MRRLLSTLLTLVLTLSLASGTAHGMDTNYSDLPASGWAREAILAAVRDKPAHHRFAEGDALSRNMNEIGG